MTHMSASFMVSGVDAASIYREAVAQCSQLFGPAADVTIQVQGIMASPLQPDGQPAEVAWCANVSASADVDTSSGAV